MPGRPVQFFDPTNLAGGQGKVHLVGEACGANYPAAEKRTWEWEFQWFNPDRSAKLDENLDRCFPATSRESGRTWTLDQMKSANWIEAVNKHRVANPGRSPRALLEASHEQIHSQRKSSQL
jgi:hypothetical protein